MHFRQQVVDALIFVEVIGAGQTAGQDDHVKILLHGQLQRHLWYQLHAATGNDRLLVQTGRDDLEAGAGQKIGNGDCL